MAQVALDGRWSTHPVQLGMVENILMMLELSS